MERRPPPAVPQGKFRRAWGWIRSRGRAGWSSTRRFFQNLKSELSETRQGIVILTKLARRHRLEPDEMQELKDQMKDVARGLPLLALIALPGGGIATVALVRIAEKVGVEMLPSSFRAPTERVTYRAWRDR